MVMWPLLLRPEPRFWLSTSDATGRPLYRAALTTLTRDRRPFDVGLTLTNAMMSALHGEVDFLAGLEAHVGFLPVAPTALVRAEALLLALDVRDLHRFDVDLEHQLDGGLHFRLGRVLHDAKDHLLVLVRDERALFGHDRREQYRHQAFGAVLGGWVLGGRIHPSDSLYDLSAQTSTRRPPAIVRRRFHRALATRAALMRAAPRTATRRPS